MKPLALFVFLFVMITACNSDSMNKTYAIRLKPGEDLKQSLQKFVQQNNMQAGWVVTCAGSLTHASIRLANQPNASLYEGHFEILSLSGTLSVNGSHLHISIADSTGKCIGGHLADGSVIYTTAEIILQQSDEFTFTREKDGTTPWEELQIKRK